MHTEQKVTAGPRSEVGPIAARGLWARLLSGLVWLVVSVVGVAGLAAALTVWVEAPVPIPNHTGLAGAATLTTVLTGLAAHRAGSRTVAATVFAALASVTAVLGGWLWLVAGVVALTAFVSAVLAVVATRPARRLGGVVAEYVVAVVLAMVGAVGAAAYQAPVSAMLLTDAVSLTAVAATLWLAYRLGGGVHGLGKRGGVVLVGALVVIIVGVAYSEALRRWGSPVVVEMIRDLTRTIRSLFGVLPPPLEVLVGFPALVWGLATRAQLRQGWWVCAFGVLATAGVTTTLAASDVDISQYLLRTAYAAGIGLVLGLLLWRVDLLATGQGRRGRRARRAERAQPMRPEPSRTRPLM